ncbi:LysM repeat protein [Micromonospora sp. Llam0]|uniref:LysM peptidoglycan-binding domain-containing protein n=1 Tax=Micromonospora sp. Llam0 TaxID=2485143 RepID=UPI000F487010|nr:LysM peptidoglycan-binding domain-containing protein [Micromonospora sp. Llam0]ROO52588.1 LysM repeat protein [Micromonospora sp. Llam0]
MRATRVSPVRRLGQVLTGLSALIILLILLVGAPVALLAFAGNPLPDHLPGVDEIGTALTSRDDGQLFIRALAVAGWLGWATFLLSVLVEVPARLRRRPAPKLPGMGRQQRVAAALVGSISLILVAGPAAAYAAPGPVEATSAAVVGTGFGSAPELAAPAGQHSTPNQLVGVTGRSAAPAPAAVGSPAPLVSPAALHTLAAAPTGPGADGTAPTDQPDEAAEPAVYRVAKGDYLGHIADRYLGGFSDYQELADLNEIGDPDRIRAGQLLRLPAEATDTGVRPHATGTVVTPAVTPTPSQPTPEQPAAPQTPPPVDVPSDADRPAWQVDNDATGNLGGGVSAGRPGPEQNLNRPLAVTAVITAASIVGAQIGTMLGLKRRTAGTSGETGRHRRDQG